MTRAKLSVEKRTVLGKKVKKLRKEGLLPANIYGKGVESAAVQTKQLDFDTAYKTAGETSLIDVSLDGQLRPVLIHNVQRDHVTRVILHADFYQVDLKEKVKTNVPLELIGEAKAVTDKVGIILQTLSEVEIEALPESLPERIEVNIEHLAAIDEQITVADLKLSKNITVLTDSSQVIVKVNELVSKEAKEQASADAAAAEAAKAEGAQGQAPAEGDQAPTEGQTPEEGKEKIVDQPKEDLPAGRQEKAKA